jgi:hypothetical protein
MADETFPNPPASDALPETSASASPPESQEPIPPEVLRSAYNAFKKRWKLTNLDQVSQIGRGPMSSGQKSAITGITPPDQFPLAVWNELVKQGRLKYAGAGCYSMP